MAVADQMAERDGDAAQEISFEAALAELERVVQELERGELPLDEAILRYQSGMRLVRACRDRLKVAEQRIEMVLAQEQEQGREIVTRPFSVEEDEGVQD